MTTTPIYLDLIVPTRGTGTSQKEEVPSSCSKGALQERDTQFLCKGEVVGEVTFTDRGTIILRDLKRGLTFEVYISSLWNSFQDALQREEIAP